MRRKSCKYLKQFCFVHWLDARGAPFHAQHPGGFPSPSKGRATNEIPKPRNHFGICVCPKYNMPQDPITTEFQMGC